MFDMTAVSIYEHVPVQHNLVDDTGGHPWEWTGWSSQVPKSRMWLLRICLIPSKSQMLSNVWVDELSHPGMNLTKKYRQSTSKLNLDGKICGNQQNQLDFEEIWNRCFKKIGVSLSKNLQISSNFTQMTGIAKPKDLETAKALWQARAGRWGRCTATWNRRCQCCFGVIMEYRRGRVWEMYQKVEYESDT